ncbi:MAG: thioredoxin [Epulopiscium sp.]|nr:thioredoxin [Candidatus Epulonipiscium sp.]
MALAFTDSNFEKEVLQSDTPVLVDFYADWCGPCRMMAPVIDELAKDYEGKAKVGKINVDKNGDTASKYGVMSIPTLLLIKNGKVVDQIVGAVPKQQLSQRIEAIL